MTELLSIGVIRPSSISFSSPILLVCNVDGSWQLCIDYQAPNQETVKNKILIPVIDDLLDKLYGSTVFYNLT